MLHRTLKLQPGPRPQNRRPPKSQPNRLQLAISSEDSLSMNADPSPQVIKRREVPRAPEGSPHGCVFLGCCPVAPVRQHLGRYSWDSIQPVPLQGSPRLLPSVQPPAVCAQSCPGLPRGSLVLTGSFLGFLVHSAIALGL